jgi:hypothetical protein
MVLTLSSSSRRNERISDTKEACSVGVNLLGSSGEIDSSVAGSTESRLPLRLDFSSNGRGGGEEEGDMLPKVWDRLDLELEGVRYGVSVGEGSEKAVSSSILWSRINLNEEV